MACDRVSERNRLLDLLPIEPDPSSAHVDDQFAAIDVNDGSALTVHNPELPIISAAALRIA
jgi:hypothetical protein